MASSGAAEYRTRDSFAHAGVGSYGTLARTRSDNAAAVGEPAASFESVWSPAGAGTEQQGVPDAMTTTGMRLNEAPKAQAKMKSPIFLENPDGTIAEAIPTKTENRKCRAAQSANEEGSDAGSSASETPAAVLHHEVETLYWRHERMMMLLLVSQFALEVLFNFVYVSRLGSSVEEFLSIYAVRQHLAMGVAFAFFRAILVLQIVYSFTFYCLAVIALATKKPDHYRVFVFWSFVGVVFQALLAYIDKFNLLIFSLRILAFIYGRLLQSLATSLQLLPRM